MLASYVMSIKKGKLHLHSSASLANFHLEIPAQDVWADPEGHSEMLEGNNLTRLMECLQIHRIYCITHVHLEKSQ